MSVYLIPVLIVAVLWLCLGILLFPDWLDDRKDRGEIDKTF